MLGRTSIAIFPRQEMKLTQVKSRKICLDFYLFRFVFSAGDWHRVIRSGIHSGIRSGDIKISRIKTGPIIYKTDLIY